MLIRWYLAQKAVGLAIFAAGSFIAGYGIAVRFFVGL